MWFNIKIVSALFEQCVLEMIMKLSTSNLLKMYSFNVKKCVYPQQTKNNMNTWIWEKDDIIQAIDFQYEWLCCGV